MVLIVRKQGFPSLKRFASGLPGLKRSAFGFTLAELLIALAILGVIATFTIPKVLQTQQDAKFKSIAKETAGMLSESYLVRKSKTGLSGAMTFADLTPYLNYVTMDSDSTLDMIYGNGTDVCDAGGWICLRLHNGALINYHPSLSFGGTATTNAIYFLLDPDGKITDGSTTGPGKSVGLYLYYDGKIRTRASLATGTTTSWGAGTVMPDPPWFSWD